MHLHVYYHLSYPNILKLEILNWFVVSQSCFSVGIMLSKNFLIQAIQFIILCFCFCTWIDVTGYKAYPDTDCLSNDITNMDIPVEECVEQCDVHPECIAFVFLNAHNKCYLKRVCNQLQKRIPLTAYMKITNVGMYWLKFDTGAIIQVQ